MNVRACARCLNIKTADYASEHRQLGSTATLYVVTFGSCQQQKKRDATFPWKCNAFLQIQRCFIYSSCVREETEQDTKQSSFVLYVFNLIPFLLMSAFPCLWQIEDLRSNVVTSTLVFCLLNVKCWMLKFLAYLVFFNKKTNSKISAGTNEMVKLAFCRAKPLRKTTCRELGPW